MEISTSDIYNDIINNFPEDIKKTAISLNGFINIKRTGSNTKKEKVEEVIKEKHTFEVKMEECKFTNEKFELYIKYQKGIHNEDAKRKTFENAYCTPNLIPVNLKIIKRMKKTRITVYFTIGIIFLTISYYIDNKLVAFSVLDILPNIVVFSLILE